MLITITIPTTECYNLSVFQGGLPVSETVLSKGNRQAAAQRADRQFGKRDRAAQVSVSESIRMTQRLQNFSFNTVYVHGNKSRLSL